MTSIEVKLKGGKAKLKEGIMLYCPSHGLGKVVSIEHREVLGEKLVFCQMEFSKDDIKLYIPVDRMEEMGIRTIISRDFAKKVLDTVLNKPAKSAKGVWTKRIQEYEKKLYSGSVIFIAEVVRDLFAGMKDPNKSYGERVLFDKAFDYLVREMSVALNSAIEETNKMILDILNSNCKVTHVNVEKSEDSDGDFDDSDFDKLDNEDDFFEDEVDEGRKK